jgi:DNA replication protein DnaC
MLIQQTIEKYKKLRLYGMANFIDEQRSSTNTQALSFEEKVGLMADTEIQDKENRKIMRLEKAAKFKVNACPEDIDYSAHRSLDRQVFTNLITCDWIKKSLNTIITGSTGVGKTWLACALGQQATRKGYSVLYKRLSRLLEELEIAYGDGSLVQLRIKLSKIDLLILDDWAIAPLSTRGRHELLELVDDRIGNSSIMITSQLPMDKWYEYLGDPTIADAILDRLVHRAHKITLRGESLRKSHSPLNNEGGE